MAKKKGKKSLDELLEEAIVKEDGQPYEVQGNWEWVYLLSGGADCLDQCRKPVNANERASRKGNIPYYGATGQVGWIDDYLTNEELVLVGEDGAPFLDPFKNKAYMISGKAWVNNHAHILRSLYGSSGDRFLEHYLNNFDYNGYVSGTTRLKLTQKSLKIMPFALPPLAEQKRIVKKLSFMLGKLKEARELIQEAKNTFEERRAAILNKAFTGELTKKWREENPDVESARKLIEILIDKRKKQGKEEKIPTYEEMIIKESKQPYGVPRNWEFVRLGNVLQINPPKYKPEIVDDTLCSFVPMKAVSDKLGIIENIEKKPYVKIKNGYTSFKENDVLFAKITPCMENGKAAIAKNLINGFGYGSTEFFVFRCSTIVDNNFLYYLVRSEFFRDLAKPNMTGTVGQRRVPKNYLNNFKFPLPPLEEQKEIVRILENLLDHEDGARALIDMEEHIDLLEKSILSKAFSSELGTNDPDDEPAIELLKRSLKEKATPAEKQDK